MYKKRVSVIIPCYNAEKYLCESVESIMNQSYTNLEIICIDDCSTDTTLAILEKLALKDDRIKVLHNSKNMKIANSLNRGLEYSTGEYIARMDADDIALPNRIEKQVDYLKKNKGTDICGTWCEKIDSEGKCIGKIIYPLLHDDLKAMLLFNSCFAHPTVMFRRAVYQSVGGYKDIMPIEDLEYWVRIVKGKRLANIPEILLKYRIHGNNVTITHTSKKLGKLLELLKEHQDFFLNRNAHWYNLRFLLSNWNERTSEKDLLSIKKTTNEIIMENMDKKIFDFHSLKQTALLYQNLAYLCCVKSSCNSFKVRIRALFYLLQSPLITCKNVKRRLQADS